MCSVQTRARVRGLSACSKMMTVWFVLRWPHAVNGTLKSRTNQWNTNTEFGLYWLYWLDNFMLLTVFCAILWASFLLIEECWVCNSLLYYCCSYYYCYRYHKLIHTFTTATGQPLYTYSATTAGAAASSVTTTTIMLTAFNYKSDRVARNTVTRLWCH